MNRCSTTCFYKLVLPLLLFFSFADSSAEKVDLVIYSYNRPLQLYALLESLETYVEGMGQVSIICKAGNSEYKDAYKCVEQDFEFADFFLQDNCLNGEDFKPLVKYCAFDSPNKYVSFLVDDIIITDYIDLSYCVQMLKKTKAYGFYLRLGENTTYSFMGKRETPVPPHTHVESDVYMWQFRDGIRHHWNYPNANDMVIYKKSDIQRDLLSLEFTNTYYEGHWHGKRDSNKYGLFFEHSKMVNISINLVINEKNWGQFTPEWKEKMSKYSPEKLLEIFNQKLKIDIRPFYKINNRAPHIEQEFSFVERLPRY